MAARGISPDNVSDKDFINAPPLNAEIILSKIMYFFSIIFIVFTFPFSPLFCLRIVQEYERAVLFRFGRVSRQGAFGPGMFFIIPWMDNIVVTDLRTVSLEIPPQEILTRDGVTVNVDAVVFYKIRDPMAAVCNVTEYMKSTKLLASAALRSTLGIKELSQLLSDRDEITRDVLNYLKAGTYPWGILVERVEVKDVRLPLQFQRVMAAEAEATRNAGAKVIAAEGEHKASMKLKLASDIISESKAALQLRYLQTLKGISSELNHTVVFPLPVDIMRHMMGKGRKKQI